jgi:hypothetical protein
MRHNIDKALRFMAAKHLFVVKLDGNLTKSKAFEIAGKIQKEALACLNLKPSKDDLVAAITNPNYASIEKDLVVDIDNDSNRADFRGQGWASCNYPRKNYSLIL